VRTFFGSIFIEKGKLKEAKIGYPIKLEYYKKINEEEITTKEKARYGISVTKTEYRPDDLKVERKDIKYLTSDEQKVNKFLETLKRNEVTPIALEDVVSDLSQIILE
jgi:hypothetical protein